MSNLFDNILHLIREYFTPLHFFPQRNRKRRAVDEPFESMLPTAKFRRLHSTSRDIDSTFFLTPSSVHRSATKLPSSRIIDTVVLDDDDDDDSQEARKPNVFSRRSHKFTSTPEDQNQRRYTNSISDDDEVTFVREIKLPNGKKVETSKLDLSYTNPSSGSKMQNGTGSSKSRNLQGKRPSNRLSIKSLDYSFRLEDKMNYKKLLETSTNNGNNSLYATPEGKLFTYDLSNRGAKILNMALNGSSPKEKLSTKDTIQKVLDNFQSEPMVIKDSDSESSSVVLVDPPSPKPDIKVDPVNSLKTIVDTSKPAQKHWIDEMVDKHKAIIERRQQEIDHLRECSERHSKINKELQLQTLTDRVNRSLKIKEQVLPEEEAEQELPELSTEQLRMVDRAFKGDMNEVLASKFNLNITRRDLRTLAGLNWLNDEVINFYMNMIIERGKVSSGRPKVYAFNTFFYPKLLKDGPQGLRRWTKRIDIFEHDMICIPIHLGMHWCMAIIDFRNKTIKYYDSMGGSNDRCLGALQYYLEAEHMDKKKTEYDTSEFKLENVKDIPQQMNGSDCGMFSCTFAEFLTRDAKISFSQEHMPYLRKKMVLEILMGELLLK